MRMQLTTEQKNFDPATAIRKAFLVRVTDAAWPMTTARLDSIFATVKRTLHLTSSSERDHGPLNQQLLEIARDWDGQCRIVLQGQPSFDAWFFAQIELICRVSFAWKQKPKKGVAVEHQHLSFGAAQKFLNLVLKDWWARSEQATELGALCCHLHAPLDDIVVSFVSRARPAQRVPSSVVYRLDKPTYISLQEVINELPDELQGVLGCGHKLTRIEFEQLVWGWIR